MKRILAVLLCLLSAYGMMAQERKLQHRPYIDQRRFHYGFLFVPAPRPYPAFRTEARVFP